MINKSSIRHTNRDRFERCIELRKLGLSYREIRKIVPIAKSTLQNWLAFSGLTLTHEHLEIQLRKRIENKRAATEASRITRAKRAKEAIQKFIQAYKKYLTDPFFVAGIMIYEAEGAKNATCRFSNSDYRLLRLFINFLERYLLLERSTHMKFRLYIHTTREKDLEKIKRFWSKKLAIPIEIIAVTWKRNVVKHRRDNPEYVGQLSMSVLGVSYLTRKLLAISSIICRRYCGMV